MEQTSFTSDSYPYGYTSLRNQVYIAPTSAAIITFGNTPQYKTQFFNRNVLGAKNKPENAVDIFFNHKLKYGSKFIFNGDYVFINNGIIASRDNNVLVCYRDGIIYYNTEFEFKRGLKSVLEVILKSSNTGIKPMISDHINLLYFKPFPKFKFNTIKEMREKYRDISRDFLERSSLFK